MYRSRKRIIRPSGCRKKGDLRIEDFIVKEIFPNSLDNNLFPRYDKVNISSRGLKRVIEKDTWKTVVQNQKGDYILTDISNGKNYIDSAYGKNMILRHPNGFIQPISIRSLGRLLCIIS